jgi:hypothetical protein
MIRDTTGKSKPGHLKKEIILWVVIPTSSN